MNLIFVSRCRGQKLFHQSHELLKTFPLYEEVEGLQVLPQTEEFSGKFPAAQGGGRLGLVAVAGKNGVVRVFALDGQVKGGGKEGYLCWDGGRLDTSLAGQEADIL